MRYSGIFVSFVPLLLVMVGGRADLIAADINGAPVQASATAASLAGDRVNPTAGENEMAGTMRMIGAHAPLRAEPLANPDAPMNRLRLERMIKSVLTTRPEDVATVTSARPRGEIVGTLEGSFSIDNRGAANYSVTLPLPDSRGYFQPALSVDYGSDSGGGELGRGFSLSTGAYGHIVRGRTILARDGRVSSAVLDGSDHFYLDGKRLVCIAGTYGRPGSVYRTEVDAFVTILAEGNGDTIRRFVLKAPNGRTYTFGATATTADACQAGFDESRGALGRVPRTFALKRVEDELGDFVEYSYQHVGYGEWVLQHIDFTGGRDVPAPFRIQFNYTTCRISPPLYSMLERVDQSRLLHDIEVIARDGGQVVTRYTFQYDAAPLQMQNRLRAINGAFASDVGAPLKTLPPTTFTWQEPTHEALAFVPFPQTSDAPGTADVAERVFEDFDGDGKIDVAEVGEGVRVGLSTRRGPAGGRAVWIDERALQRAGLGAKRRLWAGDFNGDRLSDLLIVASDGSAVALVSNGKEFHIVRTPDLRPLLAPINAAGAATEPFELTANRILLEDFNGDGRYDLLVHDRNDTLHVFYSNGTGFVPGAPTPLPRGDSTPAATLEQSFAIDLNDDGLADHAWLQRSADAQGVHWALRYAIALPDGGFGDPVTVCACTRHDPRGSAGEPYVVSGDFNGDDLPDFLVWNATDSDSGWTTFLSRGHPTNRPHLTQGTVTRVPTALPALLQIGGHGRASTAPRPSATAGIAQDRATVVIADLNGDGMDDVAWPALASGADHPTWCACLAVGDGTFAPAVVLAGPAWTALPALAADARVSPVDLKLQSPGDLNGDGHPDWVVTAPDHKGGERLVAFGAVHGSLDGQRHPGRLVTAFANGYGRTTRVRYRPGADDDIYLRGPPVEYPIVDLRPRGWIVSDRWNDEGGEIASQFTYRYCGNHLDFAGRGGMGFLAFGTFDRQTGFIKYQFLEASFPMTGMSKREETYWAWRTDNGVAIKLVSANVFTNAIDFVRDPQTRAPYGTVYPFTSQTVETHWLPDRNPDYTCALAELGAGPNPVMRALYPSSPATRTIERKWFDDQENAATEAIRWDVLELPNAFITDPVPRPRRDVTDEDVVTHTAALPAAITYGLNRGSETLATGDHDVRVMRTYFEPRLGSSAAPLVRTATRLRRHDDAWTPSGECFTYEYAGNTSFLEDEQVETWDPARETRTDVKKTHYDRDARGRLLRRTETTEKYGGAAPQVKTVVAYEASGYSADLDRPMTERTPEWTRTELRHNRLFRELASAHYGNGVTATFAYDGLGRSIRTTNDAGYRDAVDYAWTTDSGYNWTLRQQITPPPESGGLVNRSMYAVRSSETDESTETKYYDRASRVIRVSTETTKGETTWVDSVYDDRNQLVATSAPYAPSAAKIGWTVKSYDGYGIVTGEKKVETPGPTVHPTSAFAYLLRGQMAEAKEDAGAALADYSEAVKLEPTHSRAWLSLASLRRDRDDIPGAIRDASRAIEADPEFASALTFRARCRTDQEQYAEAEADLAKSLALAPEREFSWSELGRLRFRQQDYPAAVAAYSRVLEMDEDEAAAWQMRGLSHLRAEEIAAALADFDQAIRRDDKNENGYYWRGCARLAVGDDRGAVADFAKSIELDPKDASNFSGRGNALTATGRFDAALADYEKALAVEPADEQPYVEFWRFLTQRRLHAPAPIDPLKHVRTLASAGRWTKTVAAFLAGEEDEQQFVAAAGKESPAIQCEAFYYSGAMKLLAGDVSGARKRFAQAVEVRVPSLVEHSLSVAELKRLDSATTPPGTHGKGK